MMAFANFSESIAAIIGGLIAAVSFRMNFLIVAGFLLAAFVTVSSMTEPPVKHTGRVFSIKAFLRDLRGIVIHPDQRYWILLSAVAGLATFQALWYIQPMARDSGYPVPSLGLIWAGLNTLVGFSSWFSHHIPLEKHWKVFSIVNPFIFTGIYLLISLSRNWIVVAAFVPFYFMRGIQGPFFRNQIHRRIPSEQRATSLSLSSLMMRLMFVATGPAFGFLVDRIGYQRGFFWMGMFFAVVGIINLIGRPTGKSE